MPEPPYVAVIFTSVLHHDGDGVGVGVVDQGYGTVADRMEALAAAQPGYLGVETARDQLGITVSYWRTQADAIAWKQVAEHVAAQEAGRSTWYRGYRVRVATVERAYGFDRPPD